MYLVWTDRTKSSPGHQMKYVYMSSIVESLPTSYKFMMTSSPFYEYESFLVTY